LPDPYAGGIGAEGVKALQQFVEEGGTLVAMDSSSMLPIQDFNIPVRNVLEGVRPDQFSCPGSILKLRVEVTHPVAYGMPQEAAAYFAQGPAFATSVPGAGQARAVIARYPDEPLLLSGWIHGEALLKKRAAAVEVSMGKGRVILLGLRVQHRSQTHGTFKLLFNAIHYGASEPATP
ncbi:MAG TPA: peptidase M14 family protein, partial [Candidatus Polarisedimenticolia bacterium]|nr:peptidase M14 family protein [Candidatus Polarisedimenticolia bacterium]